MKVMNELKVLSVINSDDAIETNTIVNQTNLKWVWWVLFRRIFRTSLNAPHLLKVTLEIFCKEEQ